jgi:outer membrane protein TolC
MAARDQRLRELTQQLEAAGMELFSMAHQLELTKEERELAHEHLRMSELAFAAGDMDLIDLLRVQASARAADLRATELEIRLRRQTALYNQAAGVIPGPS